MQFDALVAPTRWGEVATLARDLESAGFTGMSFVNNTLTPWMSVAAAAQAAPTMNFTTGIAVALPVSPMVMAGMALELAGNSGGRFRLGLGSSIKAHVERRYGVAYEPPGPRMRDYLFAVRDILAAFRGEQELKHQGKYWEMTLLPPTRLPVCHGFGDIKLDVSAVGPWMCRMAGEIADGIDVHPLHSMQYLEKRLLPAVREGESKAGRRPNSTDLLIPVVVVPGDTAEERALLTARAKQQIGFYGSTPNYHFQFDDLGYEDVTERARILLRNNDFEGLQALVTDEMLEDFAVVGQWDMIADALISRYAGLAERIISFLAVDDLAANPGNLGRWGEIARAVRDSNGGRDA